MEVWLNEEKGGEMFRFPVVPMPLGKESSSSIDTVSIVKKGKINIYNGTEPNTIRLESFFPKMYGSYCNYKNFPSPTDCIAKIEDWEKSGAILRFIATGTPINERVIISNFSWNYKYGNGAIYYTITLTQKEKIELKEFIPPKIKEDKKDSTIKITDDIIKSQSQIVRYKDPIVKNRDRVKVDKYDNYIYTVKHGDDMVKIASMLYGNSKDWKLIKENPINQSKYPNLKKDNIILSGWELVIP